MQAVAWRDIMAVQKKSTECGAHLTYLNDLYHKFQAVSSKEKAPNEVETSSGSLL